MLSAVDSGLDGRKLLAGAFSGAGIMTAHACIVASRPGLDLADWPNVAAYVEPVQTCPAPQRAWDA